MIIANIWKKWKNKNHVPNHQPYMDLCGLTNGISAERDFAQLNGIHSEWSSGCCIPIKISMKWLVLNPKSHVVRDISHQYFIHIPITPYNSQYLWNLWRCMAGKFPFNDDTSHWIPVSTRLKLASRRCSKSTHPSFLPVTDRRCTWDSCQHSTRDLA